MLYTFGLQVVSINSLKRPLPSPGERETRQHGSIPPTEARCSETLAKQSEVTLVRVFAE